MPGFLICSSVQAGHAYTFCLYGTSQSVRLVGKSCRKLNSMK